MYLLYALFGCAIVLVYRVCLDLLDVSDEPKKNATPMIANRTCVVFLGEQKENEMKQPIYDVDTAHEPTHEMHGIMGNTYKRLISFSDVVDMTDEQTERFNKLVSTCVFEITRLENTETNRSGHEYMKSATALLDFQTGICGNYTNSFLSLKRKAIFAEFIRTKLNKLYEIIHSSTVQVSKQVTIMDMMIKSLPSVKEDIRAYMQTYIKDLTEDEFDVVFVHILFGYYNNVSKKCTMDEEGQIALNDKNWSPELARDMCELAGNASDTRAVREFWDIWNSNP